MRNETCVETQTSKVPTRVAFLFISILCPKTESLNPKAESLNRKIESVNPEIQSLNPKIKSLGCALS